MDLMKNGILLIIAYLITLSSVTILVTSSLTDGDHTRQLLGRTESSSGLPEKASYSSVEVFDIDGDGQDELILGGAGRGSVKTSGISAFKYYNEDNIWRRFGTGLPGEDSGKYYGALSFGDVNNDGNPDLIAPLHTHWYSGSKNGIEVYTSDGSGAFNLEHTIDPGESTTEADVTDVDGDGYTDIAVSTNSGIRVWFGTGSGVTWIENSPPRAGNEITGMDAGDLNNDGLIDLVGCPYHNSRAIRMYIQTSKRIWTEIDFKNVNSEAFGIKIADLDLDGFSDVIYGTRNEGIKAWLGNGGGLNGETGAKDFKWIDGSAGLHDSGGHWQQLELQDITGDGKPELIAANNGGDEVYLYLNDQPNGWAWIFRGDSDSEEPLLKEDRLSIGGEPYGANFGDWDGDGELDCAACSWGEGVKAWIIIGEGSTSTNYPGGGETPPKAPGYDEQTRNMYLIYAGSIIGILCICVVIIILYKKKKKEKRKN